jgi:hypothetical protein
MDIDPHKPGGQLSSISHARTLWEIGEFWDTHDLTEYEDQTRDVTDQFDVALPSKSLRVAVDPGLPEEARATARRRGISLETLVNLAIREALDRRASQRHPSRASQHSCSQSRSVQ